MILHKESHTDHYSPTVINHILTLFKDREGFFIETFELPENFGTSPCHLHGPTTGEEPVSDAEAEMRTREGREGLHRMCDREPGQTQVCTVIAGPHDGEDCVLFTVYPGPLAPKSPNDPSLKEEEKAESTKFWDAHALSK